MERGAPHFLQALPVPASRATWFARGHALSCKNSRYPSLSLFPSSPSNRAAGILCKKTLLSFSILLCELGSPLSGEGGPHLHAEPKINQRSLDSRYSRCPSKAKGCDSLSSLAEKILVRRGFSLQQESHNGALRLFCKNKTKVFLGKAAKTSKTT